MTGAQAPETQMETTQTGLVLTTIDNTTIQVRWNVADTITETADLETAMRMGALGFVHLECWNNDSDFITLLYSDKPIPKDALGFCFKAANLAMGRDVEYDEEDGS